jgi:hypothetical protein
MTDSIAKTLTRIYREHADTANSSPLEIAHTLLKGREEQIAEVEAGEVVPDGSKTLPSLTELQTVSSFKKGIYDENVRITFTDGSRVSFGYKGMQAIRPR